MDTFAKKMDTDARLARLVSQVNSGELQGIAEADTSPISASVLFESVKFAPESTGPARVKPKVQLTEADKADLKQGLFKLFENYEDSDEDIDPEAVDVIIKDVVHKNVGLNDAERRLPSAVQNDVLETKRSLAYELLSTIARELSEDATPASGEEGDKPKGEEGKVDEDKDAKPEGDEGDEGDKPKGEEGKEVSDFGIIPLDEGAKGKPFGGKGAKPFAKADECKDEKGEGKAKKPFSEGDEGEGDDLTSDDVDTGTGTPAADEGLAEAATEVAGTPAAVPAPEVEPVAPVASTDAGVDDIPDVDPANVEILDDENKGGDTVEKLAEKVDALVDAVKALVSAFKAPGASALTEASAGEQRKPGYQKKLAPVAKLGTDGIVDISIDLDELTKGIADGPKGKKTGGPVSSAQGGKINSAEPPASVGSKIKENKPAPAGKAYGATLSEAVELASKIIAERL